MLTLQQFGQRRRGDQHPIDLQHAEPQALQQLIGSVIALQLHLRQITVQVVDRERLGKRSKAAQSQ